MEPDKHRELKVFLHSDLSAAPTAADFSKLQNAPDNSSVRSLASATQKLSPELQTSKGEAKKFSSARSNVEGKASTLVWRGDMISAASLASLHGVERLGSESAMMKEISKAVTLFRRDTSGAR